ncbi:glycosyltransferase family 4 protein [Photobacterium sp. SDRW27]|uniref:glycosyltransferase family 4 protein n=1 Tax=Photobacterium obscurum TaxID=2829490 RepID=UPI002242D4D8|nr:glycosyltransferase family 4 protein [Photobacterium obscurum]MCW8329580.1 glycosyltransferase family 4 protein [Photobacterium obscurum]
MSEGIVIHINMASGFGGGEVQTLNLIKGLAGYQQFLIAKPDKPMALRIKDLSGITVVGFMQALRLGRQAKKLVVHAHDGRGVHIGALLAKLTGAKFVITRRVDKPLKRGVLSQLSYRRADALVGVSQKIADNMAPLGSNIRVINDSYSNLPANAKVDKQLEALPQAFTVSHICSLLPGKNVALTIEAARRIQDEYPDIHFLIVGQGPEEERLKAQAKGLDNLTFWGFTPYVGSILKHTDLLVLPSFNEGLGSVILEGYQHSVPVVAARVGGIPEVVDELKTGILIDPESVEQYSDAVIKMYSDHNFYQQQVQHIEQRKADYSPLAMVRQYQELYCL